MVRYKALLLVCALFYAPILQAQTTVTLSATEDATVVSFEPGTNFGSPSTNSSIIAERVIAGANTGTWTSNTAPGFYEGLVKFDLSPIPSDATITSAEFMLRQQQASYESTSRSIEILPIVEEWSELNVTWNNKPNRSSTVLGSFGIVSCVTCTVDVTDQVADWVSGASDNNGFAVTAPDALTNPDYNVGYYTRHEGASSNHPRLVVTYEQPTSELSVIVNNVSGGNTTIPRSNGIVKLYDSDDNLIDTQSTVALDDGTGAGKAVFSVPSGTYWAEVFHEPGSNTVLGSTEYWGKKTGIEVTADGPNEYEFTRYMPYVTDVQVFDGSTNITGETVLAGTPLTVEVTVRNDGSAIEARTRLLLDNDQDDTYDIDKTSPEDVIAGAGSTQEYEFSVTPQETGQYYVAHEVELTSDGTLDGRITDGAEWFELFELNAPPTVQITSGPQDGVTIDYNDVTFEWQGSDPDGAITGYEVEMDNAGFNTESNSQTFNDLSEGSHTFRVRAIDEHGAFSNWESLDFIVDVPPQVTITVGPSDSEILRPSDITFEWDGNEQEGSIENFEVELDGATSITSTTTQTFSDLSMGVHTFRVRSIDDEGTVSEWASREFTIDPNAPALKFISRWKDKIEDLVDSEIGEHYQNGSKHLVTLSVGGSNFYVAGSAQLILDLDDLLQITHEGTDGWVTYWVNANVGALEASVGPPVVGMSLSAWERTTNVDDPRFKPTFTALAGEVVTYKVNSLTITRNTTYANTVEFGNFEWQAATTLGGVEALNINFNVLKGEMSRSFLLELMTNRLTALPSGVIGELSGVAHQIIDDAVNVNSQGQLLITDPGYHVPFTSYDDPGPETDWNPIWSEEILRHRGGIDVDEDTWKDNIVPPSEWTGDRPETLYGLNVAMYSHPSVEEDYYVEVEGVPTGWFCEAENAQGNPAGNQFLFPDTPPNTLVKTKWLIGATQTASTTAEMRFILYKDDTWPNPDEKIDEWVASFSTDEDLQPQEFTISVLLEGAFSGSGQMSTTLNSGGYLPTSQPFSGEPWNYTGLESVDAIPSSDIVDWVLVELRTGDPTTPPMTREAQRAGFLKKDGTIVDIDGTDPIAFNGLSGDSYYIVVRHRNHLSVMSGSEISLNAGSTTSYDFTAGQNQAYGTSPMNLLGNGSYGLVAGDVNTDGQVKYSGPGNDLFPIFNAIGNQLSGTASGYLGADISMNGEAKYSGPGNDLFPIFNAVGNQLSGTRASQVPGD